ncbi:MAG: hypothetical protein ACRDKI_05165 [Solirubrobacterales bacterium]
MTPSRQFKPPQPVGEPFRADPADPAPFTVEGATAVPMPPPSLADAPVPPAPELPAQFRTRPQAAAPPQFRPQQPRPQLSPDEARNARLAKIGLALGIASILISPLVGPIAIVLGSMSISRGEKKVGAWALSTGVAGTLIGVVVVVLVLTGAIDPDQILQNLRNKQ